MLNLSENVSLVAIGSTKIKETHLAIRRCCSLVKFSSLFYFTNKKNSRENYIKYVYIPEIKSKLEYQSFIVKDFPNYILPYMKKESHVLVINWDGFVVNPNAWKKYFLKYDYIGSPWTKESSPVLAGHCGNGGFCLKSKKFLETQHSIKDFENYEPSKNNYEDVTLSFLFRSKFEKLDCKYAPVNVGYEFSTEHGNYDEHKSFGFHNFKINKKFISKLL